MKYEKGARHKSLTVKKGILMAAGWSEELILSSLLSSNLRHNEPPLSTKEVQRIAHEQGSETMPEKDELEMVLDKLGEGHSDC